MVAGDPPWGELITENMHIECPTEYAAFELERSRKSDWTFPGATLAQVRQVLSACGVTPDLIDHALLPDRVSGKDGSVVVKPDSRLITSLSSEARSKLYGELARSPENPFMRSPFNFPKSTFESLLKNAGVDGATIALMMRLSYVRGERICFSDLAFVLTQMPSEAARLNLVKTLSGMSTVMARLRIRPTTDIDKLVGYWCGATGVRVKDVRPLLESVRRLENGGAVSLVYLLPPFARKRLFTFPASGQSGEANADCHWTTLNFFREIPDDRFSNVAYVSSFVATNYYEIARPGRCGDLAFVLDEEGGAIHSAVFLADDIVFTKNGRGFGQPWQLMRLNEMISMYSRARGTQLVYYRNKAA